MMQQVSEENNWSMLYVDWMLVCLNLIDQIVRRSNEYYPKG